METDKTGTLLKLRVPARAAKLREIREAVNRAVVSAGCSGDAARDIVIAIDEACQNVIRHAYGGDTDEEIAIVIKRRGNHLEFNIRDTAPPVDAAKVKPRDLDDIRPGGLGTHFIHEVMDEVHFAPRGKLRGNLLTMKKMIS